MVLEYTVRPVSMDAERSQVGVMTLTIPRLKKSEAAQLQLTQSKITHYTGPPNVKPPDQVKAVPSQEDLESINSSLEWANTRDGEYLSQIFDPNAVEFFGYNSKEDRAENHPSLSWTLVVFGPLLDSPPSHPGTVLTTMGNLLQGLQSFVMKYAHISMNMQLYAIVSQIKRCDMDKWKEMILHTGKMHTLMSFRGCIIVLMKASGFETLLGSAFGSLTSIISGKSWPPTPYRILTAALLHDFHQDGPKTYDEILRNWMKLKNTPLVGCGLIV